MNAIIVSDLHIGSHHFLYDDFERFLGNVSEDHELILNGDIIDNPYENLKTPHQQGQIHFIGFAFLIFYGFYDICNQYRLFSNGDTGKKSVLF